MSNNNIGHPNKQGLVAAISVGGRIQHALTGTNPLEVLEPTLARVRADHRDQLRKKLSAAVEMRQDGDELEPNGFYFQDFVPLEGSEAHGWMIVFPAAVIP